MEKMFEIADKAARVSGAALRSRERGAIPPTCSSAFSLPLSLSPSLPLPLSFSLPLSPSPSCGDTPG